MLLITYNIFITSVNYLTYYSKSVSYVHNYKKIIDYLVYVLLGLELCLYKIL